ncbi:hypothetical protein L1987_24956 [Smallanthus sonchifolius]|uniref:Uncharacterized protein n=1 Tax=Smallanthus sonchifolius TaxID=185202 RepID=A0ACB9IPJ5_9ASTR|nr:hypothetical protein L1987_24956 [Smallanthus sonchifolius]
MEGDEGKKPILFGLPMAAMAFESTKNQTVRLVNHFQVKVNAKQNNIKGRQFRHQRKATVSRWVDGGKEESSGRTSGNKGWWRLVDVLGCSGGYEIDNVGVS